MILVLRLLGAFALGIGLAVSASAETVLSTSNLSHRAAPVPAAVSPAPASLPDRLSRLFGTGYRAAAAPAGLRRAAVRSAAALPGRVYFTETWVDALPAAEGDAEWRCMAEAIYHEARGESVKGQFAVAEVILNRVASPLWPNTVCKVVHQGSGRYLQCQFTWTCDGLSDRIRERAAFERVGKIAALAMAGAPLVLTEGATHYHTRHVKPRWSRTFPRTAEIGVHYFYRHPNS